MDLAKTFDDVVEIAQTARDAASGWTSLVAYLEKRGRARIPQLESVDLGRDVEAVRRQIAAVLASEPPGPELNAIYFGLFDAVDEAGVEAIGYYIAGVEGFDAQDGESLCDPAWWPEGRYLSSEALSAIKEAELAFRAGGDSQLHALLGYSGQLGAALLVSRFASTGVLSHLHRVVGFDSGDFAEIRA